MSFKKPPPKDGRFPGSYMDTEKTGCVFINYYLMLNILWCLNSDHTFCPINTGLFGILWFVAWFVLAFESPSAHPTISEEEKAYIELSNVNVDEVKLSRFLEPSIFRTSDYSNQNLFPLDLN